MFRAGSGKPQVTLASTKDEAVLLWPPEATAGLPHQPKLCISPVQTPVQAALGFAAETEDLPNRKERKVARTLMKVR